MSKTLVMPAEVNFYNQVQLRSVFCSGLAFSSDFSHWIQIDIQVTSPSAARPEQKNSESNSVVGMSE